MASNLPPGVTDGMIEDAAGGPSLLELYETACKEWKAPDALPIWYHKPDEFAKFYRRMEWLYSSIEADILALIEAAMTWAREVGYSEGMQDAEMERDYEEDERAQLGHFPNSGLR